MEIHSTSRQSLLKTKLKGQSATRPQKPHPSKSTDLCGWPAIAQFLSIPNSTVHSWAKEGMPVRREGRNVVANPEELNGWLQSTSGEAAGVRVVTPGSDLSKDLRSSIAIKKSGKNSPQHKHQPSRKRGKKEKASRKS
jgi:hypothetical protein